MRKVCRLAREVLDEAARAAKPGVTTDYIDEVVHKACIARNVSKKNEGILGPAIRTQSGFAGRNPRLWSIVLPIPA